MNLTVDQTFDFNSTVTERNDTLDNEKVSVFFIILIKSLEYFLKKVLQKL